VSAHCRFLLPVSERNVTFDEFKMSEVRLRRSIGVMLLLGSRGEKVAMLFGKLSPALFHGRSLKEEEWEQGMWIERATVGELSTRPLGANPEPPSTAFAFARPVRR
jgi:hypothetical protein